MSNCICCLSDGVDTKEGATVCALASVCGLGLEKILGDLCSPHRALVRAAAEHAHRVTANQPSKGSK